MFDFEEGETLQVSREVMNAPFLEICKSRRASPEQRGAVEVVPVHCGGVRLDGFERSLPPQTVL